MNDRFNRLSVILFALTVLTFTGCGESSNDNPQPQPTTNTVAFNTNFNPLDLVNNPVPSAHVDRLTGNTNQLHITVKGDNRSYYEYFIIQNNAKAEYRVGPYTVFVGTYGDVKISDCVIVGYDPLREEHGEDPNLEFYQDIPPPPEGIKLTLIDGSSNTFVGRNGLGWRLDGAEFYTTLPTLIPEDYMLTVNGVPVPISDLTVEGSLLTANVTLVDGRNDVSLKAADEFGWSIFYDATLWAGSNTITVFLVNPDGTPFTRETNIAASLSDDQSVTIETTTANGSATLTNIPDRTILIQARSVDNDLGADGIIGSRSSVTIEMHGFGEPGPIKNLDFSQGTAGWTIPPGTPVEIIPHVEEIPGF